MSDALAFDPETLTSHFGDAEGLLSLWIAEPYVPLAPAVTEALAGRAGAGWYGYESRPAAMGEAFWSWMDARHGWDGSGLNTSVSPSVGTSIGAMIELSTSTGDGVILQPPVFTDFKPLVVAAERSVVRSPLELTDQGYVMDLEHLESVAADPRNRMMILCNPHNPVGRVWTPGELEAVAEICARNDVFVVADEIHADLALSSSRFVPFATAAADTDVSWAATHGPIKTFGLAGVCDTLLITSEEEITRKYRSLSSRLHLTRNNVFGIAAYQAAYSHSMPWLDGLIDLVATNFALLRDGLPDGIDLVEPEGTYLAWLDLRELGLEVPALAKWLAKSARLALSPGHWFGRAGAGFARMTVAVPTHQIEDAISRLTAAVAATDA